MCMTDVKFALQWDRHANDYIGYGYKRIPKDNLKSFRAKWQEANGNYGGFANLKTAVENAYDGKTYVPGFHIFLKEEHAIKYSMGNSVVVKVKFKGVIALGTNKAFTSIGDCIIAKEMKVVEEI